VIAAAMVLFFLFFHFKEVRAFLDVLMHILRPVCYGLVIAFLLLPIHRWIYGQLSNLAGKVKLLTPRWQGLINLISILLSLLLAILVIYLLLLMVITQVVPSLVGLVQAAPGYIRRFQDWLIVFFKDNPEIEEFIVPYYNSIANSAQEWLQSNLLPNLSSVGAAIDWIRTEILPSLTSMASGVSAAVVAFVLLLKDLFIAIIVSIYLLLRKHTLAAQTKKLTYSIFPTRIGDLLVEETRNAYGILSGFINGKLLDSLIIGLICFVCCSIFRFPYPALVATVVGVTNIIPFFGPFIGAIPCAFLILLVSPMQCLQFVIFILILQQFDGNILGPKILGNSTGLDAFWVLFAILLAGGLFGFAGMVLGVPVFAMIYSVIRRLVNRGLRHHQLPTDTSYYIGPTEPQAKKNDKDL